MYTLCKNYYVTEPRRVPFPLSLIVILVVGS